MTRVYLRPGVLAIAPEEARAGGGEPVAVPGAVDALGHLADGSHELIVLGDPGRPLPSLDALEEGTIDVRSEAIPSSDLPAGSWLVTDEAEACTRVPRGVRTILVGPKRAPSHRPTARCDLEARDLAAAVMEILAREAMS